MLGACFVCRFCDTRATWCLQAFKSERTVSTMNNSPSRRVALNIRAELARSGTSIQELAEAVGLTRTTLGRRLNPNGRSQLTIDEIEAIAGHLGVPVSSLLLIPAHAA